MRYSYLITGKLQPESLIQTLSINNKFGLKHVEFDIEGEGLLNVIGSEIKITYTTDIDHTKNDSANVETLKNTLIEQVRMIVNVLGYTDSFYLDVYLLNIKCDEIKLNWNFGVKGEYNINRNEQERLNEFYKIMKLFSDEYKSKYYWLKDVFFDFHCSIKYSAQTAHYCFRAIETIRINFYEDLLDLDEKTRKINGWDKLRSELDYFRVNFKEIERLGFPNRHGQYPAITYIERERILNFTRQLIDRFVDKRLSN